MAEDHLVSYCFSFFVQEPGEAWSDLPNYNVWYVLFSLADLVDFFTSADEVGWMYALTLC